MSDDLLEAMKTMDSFAPVGTDVQLYRVFNSGLNSALFLSSSRKIALRWAEITGLIRNPKRAKIVSVDLEKLANENPKFASSVQRALKDRAQGPLTNNDGFCIMTRSGKVYSPLSEIEK